MGKINNIARRNRSIGLILLTIVLYVLTRFIGPFADVFYLSGLFQIIRVVYDHTLGLLPIPFIYLILPIVLFLIIRQFFTKVGWKNKIINILEIVLYVFCAFYLTWALNYNATPVEKKVGLVVENPTNKELISRFDEVSLELNRLSANIGPRPDINFKKLEKTIRPKLESVLKKFAYPTWGRVRVRKIASGSILRIRTTGIYIPHAFEGHVDGGLYQIQWPFTIAHEMSHGYGITHESDCNFFAYLTCKEIEDPIYKYSASLAYWRYLAYQVRSINKEHYEEIKENFDAYVKNDLLEIRKHIDRYPDLMPKYRNIIYDNYLKTHGVSAGIKSYDRMILLIEAWNKRVSK